MCVTYLSCSQLEESFKGQTSDVSSIQIIDEVVDKFIACCESKSYKRIFEFNRINDSATITIKNVKSFLDLFDLINRSIMTDIILSSPWFGHVFDLIFGVGGCFLGVVLYWFVFGCAHAIQNNKDQSKFLLISSTYDYKQILRINIKYLWYKVDITSERVQLDLTTMLIYKSLMIKSRISVERENHINMLIYALRLASEKLSTVHAYFEQRAHEIATTILEESDIFGTGLTQIYLHNHPPQADIDRVVLVAVLSDSAITQIERYLHLFKEVFIVNLSISGPDIKQSMKVSPIRLKTKGFYEINLNFLPFIDSVYYASNVKRESKTEEQMPFQQSLTSFLLSLPRFHEFQIELLDKSSGQQLGNSIKTLLQSKLRVLQKHNSKEYNSQSSPRVRVLVLERKIDQMSPLLYSYYYGPISKQIQAFDRKNHKFTSRSALYHALFSLDIQQAGELLSKVSLQKSNNQKMRYQFNEFDKAKKAISSQYDENTSTEQLKIQIQALNSAKQFCKRRLATTALQQTIVNGLSQECQKMSAGKVVDRIAQWSDIPLQDLKPSQEDYIKILILSYMVNSFWFWHRRIINIGIQGPQKEKVIKFCKKIEGKFSPLKQKTQGEQRLDLYRHQPTVVSTVKNWILKPQSSKVIKFAINQSSINRQSKIVIAINGPLGYGQLAMLMSELKKTDNGHQYIFFSESLMTTKEYLSLLLGHQK